MSDARIAVLEAQVAMLAAQQSELSGLLRDHMSREEETTRAVLAGIAAIESRMSSWRGIAIGAGLVVSAVWSVVLGVIAYLR